MSYPCSSSRQGLKPDWSTASLARRSSREPLPRCMERSVIPPPLSGCICLLAQERTSCYTHTSLPFILLFPHSLNPTLLFSVSLIFTLLRFTNTDSFLVAVLGHVFLCYPAASSRWDCSMYISDKSKQITQPCIAYITQDTLHHNVSTIFVRQAMLKCNLFNVLQWPIFPAQHLRNTFTSTFVCCSHQETCVTPAEFILSCQLTCSSLIGLKANTKHQDLFSVVVFLHWTGKKVCESVKCVCVSHDVSHSLSFQPNLIGNHITILWGADFVWIHTPNSTPKYNRHWDVSRLISYKLSSNFP